MQSNFKKVYIASDHAGFNLKQSLIKYLESSGIPTQDMGPNSAERCDYPDYAHTLCNAVLNDKDNIAGILICGTGIGMSMSANRHKGIRAALCTMETHARATREHNNANVLCLGERITAEVLAQEIVEVFLTTEFAGGRHQQRVELIDSICK